MFKKKMIPLLFSTMMVQALLANRKTMTRRLKGLDAINKDPDAAVFNRFEVQLDNSLHAIFQVNGNDIAVKCPYGNICDVLWVRETWSITLKGDLKAPGFIRLFECTADFYQSEVPESFWKKWDELQEQENMYRCRPSIFMPKGSCRLFLQVADIRLERLQHITEMDAENEGAEKADCCGAYFHGFSLLWQKINGIESWNANPWVWVLCFKQVEKPVEFNTGR